ncbi:MAG: hypothetical protein AAFU53_00690 [Cyanobacteria bacterium J06632_3]
MTNVSKAKPFSANVSKLIGYSILFMLVVIIFGPQRRLVEQQYVSAPAGGIVETEPFQVKNLHSPSVEIVTQLQYTQQALFKAEVLSDQGNVISTVNQSFDSRRSESSKKLPINDWPSTDTVKVKLAVASQSITATPPDGITADQVPVIFEVNLYNQLLNRAYLWPAFFGCIGLFIIVKLAHGKAYPENWSKS